MTIYCKECPELIEQKGKFNTSLHCKKFKIYLRTVPMDNSIIKFPIRCLVCIEKDGVIRK